MVCTYRIINSVTKQHFLPIVRSKLIPKKSYQSILCLLILLNQMLSQRFRRFGKTKLPNQTLSGFKYTYPERSYFYRIKEEQNLLKTDRSSFNQSKVIKEITFRKSFRQRQSVQVAKRSEYKDEKRMKEIKQSKNVEQKKYRHSSAIGKYVKKNDDDFEFDNIKHIINGTTLGALSERLLMSKIQHQQNQKQKEVQQSFVQKNLKRAPSDQQLVTSFVESKFLLPLKAAASIRQPIRRKSSIASNSSWTGTRAFNFIYGGQEFLSKHKEHQMALMEKVTFYKQRQMTVDYKSQWKP